MTATAAELGAARPSRLGGHQTTPAPMAVGEAAGGAGAWRVVGLDLSLASTGVAVLTPDGLTTRRLRPGGIGGHRRMSGIFDEILPLTAYADLSVTVHAVIEGLSYGSQGGLQHERAGLHWLVRRALWVGGVPHAICPPSCLKKYATGRGNAGKDEVLAAAIRRLPGFTGTGNDEADAAWLAAAGADHWHGVSVVPAAHRKALDGIDWTGDTE